VRRFLLACDLLIEPHDLLLQLLDVLRRIHDYGSIAQLLCISFRAKYIKLVLNYFTSSLIILPRFGKLVLYSVKGGST
jgi:hypothetical protein